MKEKYDIVIIGGGLGGLTVAAYLAKYGRKVLILEKNHECGGCCVSFKRKDYTFDASIHWLNNIEIINEILSDLGFIEKVELKPFNPMTKIVTPLDEFLLSFEIMKFKKQLKERFPNEKNNIERFFDEAVAFGEDMKKLLKSSFKYMRPMDYIKFGLNYVTNKLPLIRKYSGLTAEKVINSFFGNKTLKSIIHSLGTEPEGSIYPIFL